MIPLVGFGPGAGDRSARSAGQGPRRGWPSGTGVPLRPLFGTMIELPRAALTAGQIAEAAEFFSFGTNDLTQTTWGFSRDDVEAAFFSRPAWEMGHLRGLAVRRDPRPSRASAELGPASAPNAGGPPGPTSRSGCAANTAATPTPCTSSTRSAWTTSPVFVYGKTIGLVSTGRIGQATARRARGFGMKILYWGPRRKPEAEQEFGMEHVTLDRLLANSTSCRCTRPLTQRHGT